ncbi:MULTISPECIES: STN domain-containing protein [Hydrogenophaga]|uniref:Secretin/TonB short N-terminal domain-containing protein n=1 Tax=Hydrogenophaga electricum TaxID=1230953 RepID=A0ABQ6C7N8_9BURK|nr:MULTISPECIES: STN domain-containing protein [Hydrogenophaga]GLS14331.1 hypothetical protein GCM10007935_17620 [Hydrogenophaga electricum]
MLFEEESVAGKRVRALQGRYAPREALERLLLGAGIQINSTWAGVFTLKLAPVQPVLGAVTLAPVIVTVQAEREGSTEGSGSYTSVGMNTVTKLPLSVREMPQSRRPPVARRWR